MCIGIPMRILSCGDSVAVAEGRGQTERLNMLMVGELAVGTWVLAFQGSALRVIDAEEAAQTDAALDALATVLAGANGPETAGGLYMQALADTFANGVRLRGVEILTDMSQHDAERLRYYIGQHARLTGSVRAQQILSDWKHWCGKFRKVMPLEYRRALTCEGWCAHGGSPA